MSSAFINKHMTRVLAASGTNTDKAFADECYDHMNAQGWFQSLLHWINPRFGVVKNGSNELSKVFCLGTTLLPRGGDYTPRTAAQTTYSATGLNGAQPAWVNSGTNSQGYFGSARNGTFRYNNIRRLHHTGVTFFAVFEKSGTNAANLLALGSSNGFSFENLSGGPGAARFRVKSWTFGDSSDCIADSASGLTNGDAHIIHGTFDGSLAKIYVEGSLAGTSSAYVPSTQYITPLLGGVSGQNSDYLLASGAASAVLDTNNELPARTISWGAASAFSCSDVGVIGKALSADQIAAHATFLRAEIGA